jgi:hypothetical protein
MFIPKVAEISLSPGRRTALLGLDRTIHKLTRGIAVRLVFAGGAKPPGGRPRTYRWTSERTLAAQPQGYYDDAPRGSAARPA